MSKRKESTDKQSGSVSAKERVQLQGPLFRLRLRLRPEAAAPPFLSRWPDALHVRVSELSGMHDFNCRVCYGSPLWLGYALTPRWFEDILARLGPLAGCGSVCAAARLTADSAVVLQPFAVDLDGSLSAPRVTVPPKPPSRTFGSPADASLALCQMWPGTTNDGCFVRARSCLRSCRRSSLSLCLVLEQVPCDLVWLISVFHESDAQARQSAAAHILS